MFLRSEIFFAKRIYFLHIFLDSVDHPIDLDMGQLGTRSGASLNTVTIQVNILHFKRFYSSTPTFAILVLKSDIKNL